MRFGGWPAEALEFYEGLEADNSKAYWTSRKAVYEDKVRRPMEELADLLTPEFGEAKIFRPYRDIRFSHDKTPYKTHIGAVFGGTSYVQFSADGLAAGSGMWHMEPDELARYRAAVAADSSGAELATIVAGLEKSGIEVHGHGTLKSAPRGYTTAHPRIELLRHKGLTSWQGWPTEPWLHTSEAADHVVAFLRSSDDLRGWLVTHTGL
jgi:uncharacterized protein (TIGR02453 family)